MNSDTGGHQTKGSDDRSTPLPSMQLPLSSAARGTVGLQRLQRGGGVNVKTYTIGEIMRLFDLDTPGDAWELVIDSGWNCVQPLPDTKWQITIPPDELPT